MPTFLKDSSSSAILVAKACRYPLETFSSFTLIGKGAQVLGWAVSSTWAQPPAPSPLAPTS